MAEEKSTFKTYLHAIAFRALKATIKGAIFYILYLVLWLFLSPLVMKVPDVAQSIQVFVVVYVALMVIGELVAGTIFHYFFNAAKALFVIFYLVLSLNGGIVNMTFENVRLLVDLRLFLVASMTLGLFGLARSVLQAINFVNEKDY